MALMTNGQTDESETAKLVEDDEEEQCHPEHTKDSQLKLVKDSKRSPKLLTPKFTKSRKSSSTSSNSKESETAKLLCEEEICDEALEEKWEMEGSGQMKARRDFSQERLDGDLAGSIKSGDVNIELVTVDVHRELNDSVECEEKIVKNLAENMNGILENGYGSMELNDLRESENESDKNTEKQTDDEPLQNSDKYSSDAKVLEDLNHSSSNIEKLAQDSARQVETNAKETAKETDCESVEENKADLSTETDAASKPVQVSAKTEHLKKESQEPADPTSKHDIATVSSSGEAASSPSGGEQSDGEPTQDPTQIMQSGNLYTLTRLELGLPS